MSGTKLVETTPGNFSLLLNAGANPADVAVAEEGHEPNGYFWQGVAELLVPESLQGRFRYDSEGGMFCAYGTDRAALTDLAALLDPVAADPARVRTVIAEARAQGFEFDD